MTIAELEPTRPTTEPHCLGPVAGLPTRYGSDVAKARRIAKRLRWLIRGVDPEPTRAQWRARGEALLRGDPLADDLALWIRHTQTPATMQMFQRALHQGIDSVAEAPPALVDFFRSVDTPPAWVDPQLLELGAQACHLGGLTGLRAMRDAALMSGYQASAINRTLVMTGSLARSAQKRLAETSKWWVDCTSPGAMQRFAVGFKTTLYVRLMHALVRQRLRALPEWNEAELGLPVNQSDMQVTYLGFSVIYLIALRSMGIKVTPTEAHAIMHLWRYIGWLMGVDEPLLCEDEMQGRVEVYQNLLGQAPPDDSSKQLGQALMNEPLERHYPYWASLRGRWERAKQLSMTRFFLSRESMVDLGLPGYVLPWYPLLTIPRVFLWHRGMRMLPHGRDHLIAQGRAQQEAYLKVLFGTDNQQVGQLQPHIS